ncbi:DNA polymerase III subunit alpha [Salegentibacter sp. F14]
MYLNCHTYYSLRYGTFSVEELCKLAQRNTVSALALTDINNTSACLDLVKKAPEYGIKPLIGIDFRNGVDQQYVGIAKSNNSFRELNEHLATHLHLKKKFSPQAPELPECFIIYPLEKIMSRKKTRFKDNEFIGISSESLRKLKFSEYLEFKDKLVLLQSVSFRNKKDYNAHRLLRAIDNNTLLSKLPTEEQASFSHQMLPEKELLKEFEDFPYIIENTLRLIQTCNVAFDFGIKRINRNLQVFGKSQPQDIEQLRELCYEYLPQRYPKPTKEILDRIEKELKAITELNFTPYFLINLDIVKYARSKNFPFIGRGSGANSIVAYIIGITNVDPIELDLYFERFINAYRNSPPDFDIDFSWKDREEVTAYIFRKYQHTALLATYVTFKRRAVSRELGKVFGLPKEEIDKLASGYFEFRELDQTQQLVLRYSSLIEGFPNYLSVHSGGIAILNDSVYNYCATFLPPKGFRTLQIDMNVCEDVGIHKFDILAQRGLSKITDAIDIIKENQPNSPLEDIENIQVFKNDPQINSLLKRGDCMGVFYVESPAMRGLLIKLQTQDYMNLVAASSVIRPGVSSGGMKEEYIQRHRNPEKRKEAHPILMEIMPDTYGVMVYQEDVMKVAHHFADLDFDDADVLRRGMSGKKYLQDDLLRIKATFKANCLKKGYEEYLIEEVWEQIASFAGYAFPKGHSASYAVESYQSLYLKRYFPLEFMVAALNNGGGFYDVETYLKEIKRCGGHIHPPCINKSDHPTVIYGKDIYLGFGYLKELELKSIQKVLENRQFFGNFSTFDEFIDRVELSIEQLSILLRINAFRFTGIDKHQLLWKAHFKLQKTKTRTSQAVLFKPAHKDYELPEFSYSELIDVYDQIELLGFPLCSRFRLLKCKMQSSVMACELKMHIGKEVSIYGNLITLKKTVTTSKRFMYFGTFFDKNDDVFDTVHFPDIAERYPVRSKGIYLCRGIVVDELGYLSLKIKSIERQPILSDPRLATPVY